MNDLTSGKIDLIQTDTKHLAPPDPCDSSEDLGPKIIYDGIKKTTKSGCIQP